MGDYIKIIKEIASYGHEIGYHFDDLSIAKGDYNKAIELFSQSGKNIIKRLIKRSLANEKSPN